MLFKKKFLKTQNLLTASVVSISLLLTSCMLFAGGTFLDDAYKPSPIKGESGQKTVYQVQQAYRDIYNEYKDSVVFISTEKTVKVRYSNPFADDPFFRQFFGNTPNTPKTKKQRGLGTGFIVSSDGYVCTNAHVVDKVDSATVTVDDEDYKAKVIGTDSMLDIALLKIESGKKFKPVHLGNSDDVQIGDMVVAIGNPFGLDKTFTSGIVSATGRKKVDSLGNSHIQTDASINQGNSGGPLINIDGEVIGVNRAIYSQSGGSIGIGFSIPINNVKQSLLELKKHGKIKRGFIGVQISPLTEEFAKELGLQKNEGALVGSVDPDGPADKAGVQVKDVILQVDDTKISEFSDLISTISKSKIGKTVKLVVWRNKSRVNLWVTVGERKE